MPNHRVQIHVPLPQHHPCTTTRLTSCVPSSSTLAPRWTPTSSPSQPHRRGTHSSLTPSRTSRSRTPSTRRSSPRSLLPSDIFRVVRFGGSLIRPSAEGLVVRELSGSEKLAVVLGG